MACQGWLDREYLVRTFTGEQGAVLVSPTGARMPDGRTVRLPAPCEHPTDQCPPLPADQPATR